MLLTGEHFRGKKKQQHCCVGNNCSGVEPWSVLYCSFVAFDGTKT